METFKQRSYPAVSIGALVLLTLFQITTTAIIEVPGDIYIEGMFTIYGKHVNGSCDYSKKDTLSVQRLEAMKWTIEKLNNASYIPNVKIGLATSITCGNEDLALDHAYQISTTNISSLAIVGPETLTETKVTSKYFSALPQEKRLLQLGYAVTSPSLSDRETFNNFFRVVQTDDVEIRVIKDFITKMRWTYLAIIYDDNRYGNYMVDSLASISGSGIIYNEETTCFPVKLPVNTNLSHVNKTIIIKDELLKMHNDTNTIEGLLVLGNEDLSTAVLKALQELKTEHENSYVIPVMLFARGSLSVDGLIDKDYLNVSKGIYEIRSGLDNTVSVSRNLLTTQFIIASTTVAAHAVQEVYDKVCVNVNQEECVSKLISEPKYSFIEAMQNLEVNIGNDLNMDVLKDTVIKFSNDVDASIAEAMSNLNIYQHQQCTSNASAMCPEKVYEYSYSTETSEIYLESMVDYNGGSGVLTNYPNVRRPQCPFNTKCSECLQRNIDEIDVKFGDMYVILIAPIHRQSDTTLTCGKIKNGGFDFAAMIEFTIKQANEGKLSSVPNANIGYIIIDSCSDSNIIIGRIFKLHTQGIYQAGNYIDVRSKILGYIGGWTSGVSIAVADMLSRLGYVQISYGSTSPLLSDRNNFPYFMRVVPSDINQADQMLKVVEDMGSNLVQILYSETTYGIGGKEAIESLAFTKYKICVTNKVGYSRSVSKEQLISELSEDNSPKVVMVFLTSPDVVELIDVLNERMKGYIFVASEGWGHSYVRPYHTNLVGSVVFANAHVPMDTSFIKHFANLSTSTTLSPWIVEYMEHVFNCAFEWSFDKRFRNRNCGSNDTFVPCFESSGSCFRIETWAPFVGVAIKALLKGARTTLLELCDGDSSTVCLAFIDNPVRLAENIGLIKLAYDKVSEKQVFDEKHDGLIPYNKHTVVVVNGKAVLRSAAIDNIARTNTSTCETIPNQACQECFGNRTDDVIPTPTEGTDHVFNAMLVFLSLTIVLVTALIGVIIAWKKQKCLCTAKGDNNTYLHAMYDSSGYIDPLNVKRENNLTTYSAGDSRYIDPANLKRGDNIPTCSGNDSGYMEPARSNNRDNATPYNNDDETNISHDYLDINSVQSNDDDTVLSHAYLDVNSVQLNETIPENSDGNSDTREVILTNHL